MTPGIPPHQPAPNALTEAMAFAYTWWENDERDGRLPGEERDHTVFVIDYFDGCKHFGYTSGNVMHRVASLASYGGSWSPNHFVQQHAAEQVPYVVRCLQSNLTRDQAQELRDTLVSTAPENAECNGTSVQHQNCWVARSQRMLANEARLRNLP